MKWVSGLVMTCVACGGATSPVGGPAPNRDALDAAQRFVSASRGHDVAAVRSMLADPTSDGGLWFTDPACRTEFHETGDVTGPRLDALARCLATLDLRTSPRRDALYDVAVLSYGPGFELEARFAEDHGARRLRWIGYAARLEGEGMPTVAASALEALRTAGERNGPVAGLDPALKARAWLKVCVDASGAVTDANVRQTTSTAGAQMFMAAARTWRFQPFLLEGQAVPVCAMFAMSDPGAHAGDAETLPLPLPMHHGEVLVPQNELHRVTGDKSIVPDDKTKTLLASLGISKLVGSFKLCLDSLGHVSEAVTLQSTRSIDYDAKILRELKTWTYEPALIDGKPTGVCTSINFIYSQR